MKHSRIRATARRVIASSLVVAAGGVYAAAAGAAPPQTSAAPPQTSTAPRADAPRIAVHYADLNLGTETGVQALYSRLVHAANQVCGVEYNRDLRVMQAMDACLDAAVARAVREVASPRLATLAAAHTKAG